MVNKNLRIKWAGPNTPFLELIRNNNYMLCTKRELLDLQDGIREFIDQYPESFIDTVIDNTDSYTDLADIL